MTQRRFAPASLCDEKPLPDTADTAWPPQHVDPNPLPVRDLPEHGEDPCDLPGSRLEGDLLRTFRRQQRPLRTEGLLRVLGLPRRSRKDLEDALYRLAERQKLVRLRGGFWTLPGSLREVVGRYTALRNGAGGFVTPQDEHGRIRGADIFIHPLHCGDAWHADIVRVLLAPRSHQAHGRSPEGRIVDVLERGQQQVAARVLDRAGQHLHCRALDSRLPLDFSVNLADRPLPGAQEVRPGALVMLAPQERLASDLWQARLLRVDGDADAVSAQENLVKINHQVPQDFPPRALAEAKALPASPTAEDMQGREDLRALPLVTIDAADARDFDDAVHVERLAHGWLLRVAIADVSHYVRPRSALDAEAFARGNSWYFPASVEPMLPRELSNGLCSLNPGEDRLCLLAEVQVDQRGLPQKSRFATAVMRSAARLTYEAVDAALSRRDTAARQRLLRLPRGETVLAMLEEAHTLFEALRHARRRRGSLDFDLPEPRYRLDDAGHLLGIDRRERLDAHRLIEEFMIAANEAVARFLGGSPGDAAPAGDHSGQGLPVLFRVHPQPEAERLDALFDSLSVVAPDLLPPRPSAASLQGILQTAQGTDQEFVINRLCLRSMPQARYQPWNEGHFGLASMAYCHFTSPIRRYADLLVHRIIKLALGQGAGSVPIGQKLLRVADQLNRREREAMECEREMARRLACLALREQVGQRFSGIIAGVTDFGLFVELRTMPVEGMIRVEDIGPDWFQLDERRHALVGQRSGVVWHMGQRVDVQLADVNAERLEIRLVLPGTSPAGQGAGRAAGRCHGSGQAGRQRPRKGHDLSAGGKAPAPAPWHGRHPRQEAPTRDDDGPRKTSGPRAQRHGHARPSSRRTR